MLYIAVKLAHTNIIMKWPAHIGYAMEVLGLLINHAATFQRVTYMYTCTYCDFFTPCNKQINAN